METLIASTTHGKREVKAQNIRQLRQEVKDEYVLTYLLLEGPTPSICVWCYNRHTGMVSLKFDQVSAIYSRLIELVMDPYTLCIE